MRPIPDPGHRHIVCTLEIRSRPNRPWSLGHSVVLDTILTAGLGLSFGFQLAPVIVPVQNALPLEDTGIGMGTVMFFLLIGDAFGVALLSAVLMAELNAAALGVPGHATLGADPGWR